MIVRDRMTRFLLLIMLVLPVVMGDQGPTWVYWGGSSVEDFAPVSETGPGSRLHSCATMINGSHFVLFGGESSSSMYTNDFWMGSLHGQSYSWAHVGGSRSDALEGAPTADALYHDSFDVYPKGRRGHACWPSSNGTLMYIFGGESRADGALVYMNDLWAFDGTKSSIAHLQGSQIVGNISSSSSYPGGRSDTCAQSYGDAAYIFGGFGVDHSGNVGLLADVFAVNLASNLFELVGGSSLANQESVYRIMGTADSESMPGGRRLTSCFFDVASDALLLHGGAPSSSATWSFDLNERHFTWVSGSSSSSDEVDTIVREFSNEANPGERYGASYWTVDRGSGSELHILHGGMLLGVPVQDTWIYDATMRQWMLYNNVAESDESGVFPPEGQGRNSAIPPALDYPISITDRSGKVLLYGGGGFSALWTMSPCDAYFSTPSLTSFPFECSYCDSEYRLESIETGSVCTESEEPVGPLWVWWDGESTPFENVSYPSSPGARWEGCSAMLNDSHMLTFGGSSNGGALNDLWLLVLSSPNVTQWNFVGGSSSLNHPGQYGIPGEAYDPLLKFPGSRSQHSCFAGPEDGSFYIFAGQSYGNIYGEYSDTWKYMSTPGQFQWITGPKNTSDAGSLSMPGGRQGACVATTSDAAYIYGGYGADFSGGIGILSDLYSFSFTTESFLYIGGSTVVGADAVEGSLHIPAPDVHPGYRVGHQCFYDSVMSMIIITGGFAASSHTFAYYPHLGMFALLFQDSGSHVEVYQDFNSDNDPSPRIQSAAYWTSKVSNDTELHYILNGWSPEKFSLDTLWVFNAKTNQWKLMEGSMEDPQEAIYTGLQETEDRGSMGRRGDMGMFSNRDGAALVYGGFDSSSIEYFSDMWSLSTCSYKDGSNCNLCPENTVYDITDTKKGPICVDFAAPSASPTASPTEAPTQLPPPLRPDLLIRTRDVDMNEVAGTVLGYTFSIFLFLYITDRWIVYSIHMLPFNMVKEHQRYAAAFAFVDVATDIQFTIILSYLLRERYLYHMALSILCLNLSYSFFGSFVYLKMFGKERDYQVMEQHPWSYIYLRMLSVLDPDLMVFWPWKYKSRFKNIKGFPRPIMLVTSSMLSLLTSVPMVYVQILYLYLLNDFDFIAVLSMILSIVMGTLRLMRLRGRVQQMISQMSQSENTKNTLRYDTADETDTRTGFPTLKPQARPPKLSIIRQKEDGVYIPEEGEESSITDPASGSLKSISKVSRGSLLLGMQGKLTGDVPPGGMELHNADAILYDEEARYYEGLILRHFESEKLQSMGYGNLPEVKESLLSKQSLSTLQEKVVKHYAAVHMSQMPQRLDPEHPASPESKEAWSPERRKSMLEKQRLEEYQRYLDEYDSPDVSETTETSDQWLSELPSAYSRTRESSLHPPSFMSIEESDVPPGFPKKKMLPPPTFYRPSFILPPAFDLSGGPVEEELSEVSISSRSSSSDSSFSERSIPITESGDLTAFDRSSSLTDFRTVNPPQLRQSHSQRSLTGPDSSMDKVQQLLHNVTQAITLKLSKKTMKTARKSLRSVVTNVSSPESAYEWPSEDILSKSLKKRRSDSSLHSFSAEDLPTKTIRPIIKRDDAAPELHYPEKRAKKRWYKPSFRRAVSRTRVQKRQPQSPTKREMLSNMFTSMFHRKEEKSDSAPEGESETISSKPSVSQSGHVSQDDPSRSMEYSTEESIKIIMESSDSLPKVSTESGDFEEAVSESGAKRTPLLDIFKRGRADAMDAADVTTSTAKAKRPVPKFKAPLQKPGTGANEVADVRARLRKPFRRPSPSEENEEVDIDEEQGNGVSLEDKLSGTLQSSDSWMDFEMDPSGVDMVLLKPVESKAEEKEEKKDDASPIDRAPRGSIMDIRRSYTLSKLPTKFKKGRNGSDKKKK